MPRQKAITSGAAAAAEDEDDAPAAKSCKLLIAHKSNALEVHSCTLTPGGGGSSTSGGATEVIASVKSAGHRAEPRGLGMSVDERLVVSAGDGEAKVWSVRTQQCISTLGCGYALSCAFILASKYIVVGTKSGSLQVYSLASAECVCEIEQAHTAAVWSLAVQPGGTRLLSGSADKSIALWAPSDDTGIAGGFELTEIDRHECAEDVLCAAFTPNAKHIAIALLDASIKIINTDSFDLFLTLYGHKLPVLSVSAASDNAILVSGSADKTIKIWGLDFGDCHRSLHGHTESVMCVAFVRETHYFFSSSKDLTIRYWDADRFEHIMTLRGHLGEVWGCVPSRSGQLLASVSRDRSLRLWRRTDEQLFVEEEREAELERLFEAGLRRRRGRRMSMAEEAAAFGLLDTEVLEGRVGRVEGWRVV